VNKENKELSHINYIVIYYDTVLIKI